MHFDMQGFAYDFDLSGKDFPTPDGGTTSWREVNPTMWEATNKVNGKAIATYQLTLKGNTINAVMKATKPDGSTLEQTSAWSRVSGGSGFRSSFTPFTWQPPARSRAGRPGCCSRHLDSCFC